MKKTKKNVFNHNDYKSGSGMLTSVWGPSMWHFLHVMSFNYPEKPTKKEKKKYRKFIISLQDVLPCKYCRENLKKNFSQVCMNDECFRDREAFSRFIFNLHNKINKMLNKKYKLTYEETRDCYENFRSRCNSDSKLKKKRTLKKKNKNKEEGCTKSLYGVKSKCCIHIVPKDCKKKTFKIDKNCYAYKIE